MMDFVKNFTNWEGLAVVVIAGLLAGLALAEVLTALERLADWRAFNRSVVKASALRRALLHKERERRS